MNVLQFYHITPKPPTGDLLLPQDPLAGADDPPRPHVLPSLGA